MNRQASLDVVEISRLIVLEPLRIFARRQVTEARKAKRFQLFPVKKDIVRQDCFARLIERNSEDLAARIDLEPPSGSDRVGELVALDNTSARKMPVFDKR